MQSRDTAMIDSGILIELSGVKRTENFELTTTWLEYLW